VDYLLKKIKTLPKVISHNKISLVIKFLLSGALVLFIINNINFADIFDILKRVNLKLYIFAIFLYYLCNLIKIFRWRLILLSQNIDYFSHYTLFKINITGMIFNHIFPSNIGGDSVKILQTVNLAENKKLKVGLSVIVDRIFGIIALFFILFTFIPFNILIPDEYRLIIFFSILGIIVSVIIILKKKLLLIHIKKIQRSIKKKSILQKVLSLFEYKIPVKIIIISFCLSLLFHFLGIYNEKNIFKSLEIEISFSFLLFAMPLVRLLLFLPISLGGIGLKEISMIGLMKAIGVSSEEIISFSMLVYSFFLVNLIVLSILKIADYYRERLHL
jgi:uncharacterized protein (TIRG00374 family)